MIKTLILQLTLVFTMAINSYCQDNTDFLFRHTDGTKGVFINVGALTEGFYGLVGYSYYFKNYYFLDCSLMYESGRYNYTDFTSFRLNAINNFNIYSYKKALYFNGHLGGFLGQETIKEVLLDDKNDKNYFIYGLVLGINFEYYISNKLSVNLELNQNIIKKSLVRNNFISADIGFKIFF